MSDFSLGASIGLTHTIPSGAVHTGSRFHPREDHTLRQVLHVPEFDIAHAQVTVSQYAAFLTSREFSEQRWWGAAGWAWLCGEGEGWGRENRWQPEGWEVQRGYFDHPVTGVTFYEAEAYCNWLSDEKKRRARLPTEAEWERAARGDDERPFPWGQEFDPRFTNTYESGRKRTSPVGDTPGDLSPFGVLNMAGNVQEWTVSAYNVLPGEVCPPGPLLVARGGSFNDTAYAARVSYRRPYPPGFFYPFLGFRIVVSAV